MQVFANLCDPHSFMHSIMKAGENYSIANCNFFDGLSLNTNLLKKAFPNNPITVPLTGHSLFAKIYIDYIAMHASYPMDGDYRKFFEVFNIAGKLLFSIGFEADPYPTGNDVQPLAVYTWNDDGTLKSSKSETSQLYPMAVFSNYTDRIPNRALSYYYVNDPNDINNSKIEIYYGTELLLTMSGSELGTHVDHDPAKAYFFRTTLNFIDSTSYRHRLSYIVVTDTKDFSLEPILLKPLAFTYSDGFTGGIAALRETFQDNFFVSCSAETGKYVEFTLESADIGSSLMVNGGKILAGCMNFYGRYLRTGGTSVTFNISIYNAGNVFYSEDVIVIANEDSSFYRTKLLTAISSGLSNLQVGQFKSFTVRISLKGV